MEVADIAVKPVKEFAKDSYRLIRKCTKPDRKEFSKIATRTGMGFIVMGFVGFFVKLILYVCHARFLALSSRVHPRWFCGSLAFDPSNDPASRKICLPRPLAIEAARGGRGAGFRVSDPPERVMSPLAVLRPSRTNDTRARTRRVPRSPSAVREGWIDEEAHLRHPRREEGTDSSSANRSSVFGFSVFRVPALADPFLPRSFPQHPHQQHHPRRVREGALAGSNGGCNLIQCFVFRTAQGRASRLAPAEARAVAFAAARASGRVTPSPPASPAAPCRTWASSTARFPPGSTT